MKRILAAALALASLMTLALPARVEAIPIVSVGSATVTVGDIFTIPVSITDAVDLTSFQFDLSFTPSILQVTPTGVSESPFFTQGDSTLFVPGVVDNTTTSSKDCKRLNLPSTSVATTVQPTKCNTGRSSQGCHLRTR